MNVVLTLAATLLSIGTPPISAGEIGGLVVNGSQSGVPLAGAHVVVRVMQGNEQVAQQETTADEHGHFVLRGLPALPDFVHVVGVNHQDVHYPGARVVLEPSQPTTRVRLVAFDAVTEPSPLVALKHEIDLRLIDKTVEVTETILVSNPLPRGYVGLPTAEGLPTTLRLRPMAGFETVTFHNQFLGRNFMVHEGQLTTNLPWTPGVREIKLMYRVPVESRNQVFARRLDLPCGELVARFHDLEPGQVDCAVGNVELSVDSATGEHRYTGASLPADTEWNLRLRGLPVSPLAYGKWVAIAVLGGLAAVTLVRKSQAADRSALSNTAPSDTKQSDVKQRAVSSASPTEQTPRASRSARRSSSPVRSP